MNTLLARHWAFLNTSFRNARRVGAVAPSSRRLAASVAAEAGACAPKVIVELGAGTGALTGALLDLLPPDGKLLAFEVEAEFQGHLRRLSDPRLHLIARSAEHLGEELDRLGLASVPCVVSGLPFQVLPEDVAERILLQVRGALAPGGRFVAFQYAPWRQPRFRRHFAILRRARMVWGNLPPAWVMVGEA